MSLDEDSLDELSKGLFIIRPHFYLNTIGEVKLKNLARLADITIKHMGDPPALNLSVKLEKTKINAFFKNPSHHE
jgi:hypothetical protein